MKYGNGTETFYNYEGKRRRLHTLSVSSSNYAGAKIMDNAYTYDAVDNITQLVNSAQPQSDRMGGQMTHNYEYDEWYRLIGAQGTYIGADRKTAAYKLEMGYDKLYNMTGKKLDVSQTNVQFDGTLFAGHDLTYNYNPENPFQLANINAKEYRSETENADTVKRNNQYTYDANGNLLSINADSSKQERSLLWDEENRLLSVNDNGFVSNYWYDASGERVVKTSCENENVYVNGAHAGGLTNTKKFTAYIKIHTSW